MAQAPDCQRLFAPILLGYPGREVFARFLGSVGRRRRRFDLVPTWANGRQLAFGIYLRAGTGGIRL
jgi:hypothetical protein